MRIRNLAEIALLGLMWGPSFLFIKLGVEDLAPLTLVASRVLLGSLILYLILRLRKTALPRDVKTWWHLGVTGFFACSFPYMLFAFGELTVSSVTAGIINGSTPIFTALLAHFCLPAERLNLSRVVGVLVGLLGFTILLLPSLLECGLKGDSLGMLAILVASISYAIAFVYTRKFVADLPPLVGPTAMLITSAVYMVPVAVVAEPLWVASEPTWTSVLSVCGLGLMGTAIAYAIYYRVIAQSGPVSLSMSLYIMTFFSVLLGRIILGEKLAWTAYLAGALILLGMVIVNNILRLPSRLPVKTRPPEDVD
jgi:drug/metabolite transporter (DMT)-like permease